MTNWKCNCGVVNFSTDETCKRCQSQKPQPNYSSHPYQKQEFYEHSAPNGDAASGVLKAIGIGSLFCGFGLGALAVVSGTEATKSFSTMLALLFVFQGVVIFALFFGFGILIDNVVAIRKNTQHLAGIRANTVQQPESNWQA